MERDRYSRGKTSSSLDSHLKLIHYKQETTKLQPAEPDLKFTSVMNNLQQAYPKQAMDDISTSYCFICLLHLANEKGLAISNEPGLEELSIRMDPTAEIAEVGA